MTERLDLRGLLCPLPVLRASQRLATLRRGARLEVLATDPASIAEMKAWAAVDRRVEVVSQRTTRRDGATVYVHRLLRR